MSELPQPLTFEEQTAHDMKRINEWPSRVVHRLAQGSARMSQLLEEAPTDTAISGSEVVVNAVHTLERGEFVVAAPVLDDNGERIDTEYSLASINNQA